jgi:hypothetical protein
VMLSSDQNEHNTLAIFALKCAALFAMRKPITVQALFPGYAEKLEWLDEAMSFDADCKISNAGRQVDMQTWAGFLSERKTTGGFFVNAPSAAFCDMMIIPKGGKHVILIQEKQEQQVAKVARLGKTLVRGEKRKAPSFKVSRVTDEHKKCNVKTKHLFVMVADRGFTDGGELEKNEIVLPGTDHAKAIGPLLALLRLHNHGHRDKLKP